MSKRIAMIVGAGLALLLPASAAWTMTIEWTSNLVITDSVNDVTLIPRLSPKVEIKYVGATHTYAIGGRSSQGDKTYAVNAVYTGVFVKDGIDIDFSSASEAFDGWRQLTN